MTYTPKDGDYIMCGDTHQIIGRYRVDLGGKIIQQMEPGRVRIESGHDLYSQIGQGNYDLMNAPVVISRLGRYYVAFYAVHHPVLGLIVEAGAKELEHCSKHLHFSLSCAHCLDIVPKENEHVD